MLVGELLVNIGVDIDKLSAGLQQARAVIQQVGEQIERDTAANMKKATAEMAEAVEAPAKTAETAVARLKSAFANIWDAIKAQFSRLVDYLKSAINAIIHPINTIQKAFSTLADRIKTSFISARDTVLNFISAGIERLAGAVANPQAAISSLISRVRELASSIGSGLVSALRAGGSALVDFGKSLAGVVSRAGVLTSVFGGIAASVTAGFGLKTGIDINAQLEQAEVSFRVLMGSAEKARKTIQELYEYSANTPFEFPDVAQAGRTLETVGLNARKTLEWVGDLAAANPQATIEEVARAIARLKSGDFGEAFERLRDFGISRQMLEGEGLVFDRGGAYKGSVEQALRAVENIVRKRFGGMAKAQSQTFTGMLSTLADNVNMLLGDITKPLFDRLKQIMPQMINFVGQLREAFKKGGFAAVGQEIAKLFGFNFGELQKNPAFKGFMDGMKQVKNIVADVVNFIRAEMPQIVATVKSALELLGYIWGVAWKRLGPVVSAVWNAIKAVIDGALKVIRGIIEFVLGLITGDWNRAWNGLKTAADGVLTAIKGIVRNAVDAIKNLLSGIAGQALEWGKNIIRSLGRGIEEMIGWLREKARRVAQMIKDFLGPSSPTKEGPGRELDKWGPNWVRTIAEGMLKNLPLVQKTSELIAAAVQPQPDFAASISAIPQQMRLPKTVRKGTPIVLQVDGRELARVISVHIDRELERMKAVNLRVLGVE